MSGSTSRRKNEWPRLPCDSALHTAFAALGDDHACALFESMDRDPRSLSDAALDANASAAVMAAWLAARSKALEPPGVDAAIALLSSCGRGERATWLALRIVATLPKSLLWKAPALFLTLSPLDDGALSTALRECLTMRAVAARLPALRWLATVGALAMPDDAVVMLRARDRRERDLGASLLEALAPGALAPAADAIAEAASKETGQALRRVLARLARAARPASAPTGDLVERIAIEWDAGGTRPQARKLLDELEAQVLLGAVSIAALARSAASGALRNECARRVEARLTRPNGPSEDDLDREVLDATDATDVIASEHGPRLAIERTARLEQSMVDGRPLRFDLALRFSAPGALLLRLPAGTLALVDARYRPALSEAASVVVVHPATLEPKVLAMFRARAGSQPIEQLNRSVFRLDPAERRERCFLLPVRSKRTAFCHWSRGWIPEDEATEELGEWDAFCGRSSRAFASWGIRAHWTHLMTSRNPGVQLVRDRHDEDDSQESLSFTSLIGKATNELELGDVPVVAFSEIVRELVGSREPVRAPGKRVQSKRPRATRHDSGSLRGARIASLVERVWSTPDLRIDARRAIERLGEGAVTLMRAIMADPDDWHASWAVRADASSGAALEGQLEQLEAALSGVVARS